MTNPCHSDSCNLAQVTVPNTSGDTVSFTDRNTDSNVTYYYRAHHYFENEQLFTTTRKVAANFRASDTLKLKQLRRVDFSWDDSWVPQNGDMYLYELERQRGENYYKVADLNTQTKFVTDYIPADQLQTSSSSSAYVVEAKAWYRIKCLCIYSNIASRIGEVFYSGTITVKIP